MPRPPFKFAATTRVGFSDTDAQGIVYYGRYMPYFDLARVEYHRALDMLRDARNGATKNVLANTVSNMFTTVTGQGRKIDDLSKRIRDENARLQMLLQNPNASDGNVQIVKDNLDRLLRESNTFFAGRDKSLAAGIAGARAVQKAADKTMDTLAQKLLDQVVNQYAALDKSTMEQAPWAPYGNRELSLFTSDKINFGSIIWSPVFDQDYSSFQLK